MSKLYNKYTQPKEGDTGSTKKVTKKRFERERKRAIKTLKGHKKAKEMKRHKKVFRKYGGYA